MHNPLCFYPKETLPLPNVGSILDEAGMRRQFPVNLSRRPVQITDDLVFLGRYPGSSRLSGQIWGRGEFTFPMAGQKPDLLLEDSALVFNSGAGLVIIIGCSHAGICSITEYRREVCGEGRVIDIIGGLHLLTPSLSRLKKTGKYLQTLQLQAIHPCHCKSLSSKIALAAYCSVKDVGTGMRIGW